ncbi:MAG TPA: amidase [Saprospiraceae bacterium]|nr:amidase [Saprospiraceae bacterium]
MKKYLPLGLVVVSSFVFGAFTFGLLSDEIEPDDVYSAAKIMGLEFTQAEVDSLIAGLESNLNAYERNRELDIPNGLAPATDFNPFPTGYELPSQQLPIRYSIPTGIRRPEKDEDLAWLTVRQLAELIQTRQLSSVELTNLCLERLKKYDETLHCVISLTEELAIEQARRADAEIAAGKYRGLLHGIPYGAKDLLAVEGYKTTWGAMPYKDQVIDDNATVINQLEEAGAVLVAKLTLGALAMGDVWYGEKTRNPWNPERGSSGSSAGSASAVAAGLVPFAIGTETLGSIVSPSTVCGTTGLRPTYGRVSRYGAMALSWSMDKIGPITRSVEDAAIVFEAIHGPDGKDMHLYDAPFNYDAQADPKRIKVGYVKSAFGRDYGFKENDSLALRKMEALGFELIPITLPDMPDLGVILAAEAAAAFDELTRSGADDQMVRQLRGAWPNYFRTARFIPAVEYIQANRLRTRLIEEMSDVFDQVDVYIHPSWSSSSLRITNHTGHPCVVLPNGFRDGTPTSISFTGRLFEEGILMEVARAYQEATAHHLKHPEL